MGVFDGSASALEEKLEMMKLKNQLLDEKVSAAEKKSMIKELKRKYGKDWKNILKIGNDSDMFRQFANAGRKMGDIGAPTLSRPRHAPAPGMGRSSDRIYSDGRHNSDRIGLSSSPYSDREQKKRSVYDTRSLIEGSRKSLGSRDRDRERSRDRDRTMDSGLDLL